MKLKFSFSYSVAVIALAAFDQEQRVAVRRRTHDQLRGAIGAGARPVLDHERLAKPFRQPLAHQACEDIGPAAGRIWHDQTHWSRRIGLRPCDTPHSRECGSARGQMQKSTRGRFIALSSGTDLRDARSWDAGYSASLAFTRLHWQVLRRDLFGTLAIARAVLNRR